MSGIVRHMGIQLTMQGILLALMPLTVWASDYYECTSPDGAKTFQLEKCGRNHRQTAIHDPAPPISRPLGREVATTQVLRNGGHFSGTGYVNGKPFPMLVDTGATYVAMNRDHAIASGVSLNGQPMQAQTANGVVRGVLSKAAIAFAGHELKNIDVVVQIDGGLPGVLLGMSYLNNFDINMSGSVMSLTRK